MKTETIRIKVIAESQVEGRPVTPPVPLDLEMRVAVCRREGCGVRMPISDALRHGDACSRHREDLLLERQ